mmetsp:Transcript_25829/g.64886  ORF Transcript_25829/g.64886 Transcript_25829/m.64886 type:complete len:322 (-) Transcript_25829:722-1687(-)
MHRHAAHDRLVVRGCCVIERRPVPLPTHAAVFVEAVQGGAGGCGSHNHLPHRGDHFREIHVGCVQVFPRGVQHHECDAVQLLKGVLMVKHDFPHMKVGRRGRGGGGRCGMGGRHARVGSSFPYCCQAEDLKQEAGDVDAGRGRRVVVSHTFLYLRADDVTELFRVVLHKIQQVDQANDAHAAKVCCWVVALEPKKLPLLRHTVGQLLRWEHRSPQPHQQLFVFRVIACVNDLARSVHLMKHGLLVCPQLPVYNLVGLLAHHLQGPVDFQDSQQIQELLAPSLVFRVKKLVTQRDSMLLHIIVLAAQTVDELAEVFWALCVV